MSYVSYGNSNRVYVLTIIRTTGLVLLEDNDVGGRCQNIARCEILS